MKTPFVSQEPLMYSNDKMCVFSGQLKAVMEHVLVFAVCELTKIVEDSFDDLLVEFTEKERENQILKDQLRDKNEEEDDELVGGKAKDYYNDSDSPSSSKVERRDSSQEPLAKKGREKEQTETTNGISTFSLHFYLFIYSLRMYARLNKYLFCSVLEEFTNN